MEEHLLTNRLVTSSISNDQYSSFAVSDALNNQYQMLSFFLLNTAKINIFGDNHYNYDIFDLFNMTTLMVITVNKEAAPR